MVMTTTVKSISMSVSADSEKPLWRDSLGSHRPHCEFQTQKSIVDSFPARRRAFVGRGGVAGKVVIECHDHLELRIRRAGSRARGADARVNRHHSSGCIRGRPGS